MCPCAPNHQRLSLRNTKVTTKGVAPLIQACAHTLQWLDLSLCSRVSDEVLVALATAKTPSLVVRLAAPGDASAISR